MRIYLASNFQSQERLKLVRAALETQGHEIVSTWLDEDGAQAYELHPARGPGYAVRDVQEVGECELLIIDTLEQSNTGGREVEYGIAIASGKRTWRVGPARNIFHAIARRAFDGWNEVYEALRDGSDQGLGRGQTGLRRVPVTIGAREIC